MKNNRWKSLVPEEKDEQEVFVDWLELNGFKVIVSANGGSRHKAEAKNLKRLGVRRGVPDVQVPYAVGDYHGFFLEMKRKKNSRPTIEQIEWIDYLKSEGYYAVFAKGFEEAQDHFLNYLNSMASRST